MKSLRWKTAVWFAVSVIAVLGIFVAITHSHLTHELRIERWERAHPEHADWVLHGSYSDAEVDDITGELWRLSLLYAAPVTLVALGIGYALARRSLRPIAELDQQLSRISARSLNQRIHLANADRELQPIEANINDLLARLDAAFAQLTEYSAQVAHELRTPLTLLRLQLEDAAGKIEPELAESIQGELARLSDYVDQCLLLAMAEQGRLELKTESVPMGPLIEDMLETYTLWAAQSERALTLSKQEDFTVLTDARYVRQMLHNLLTNAIRHGSGPIRVTLASDQAGASCRIENAIPAQPNHANGSSIGLRMVRALSHALSCQFEAHTSPAGYTAELRWMRPCTPAEKHLPASETDRSSHRTWPRRASR